MTEVRKENSEALEYVCPECGETFEEGADECSGCGIEFDWSDEMEYLCPECGTVVDPDISRCPGCAARFSKEGNGDVLIEYEPDRDPPTVDEMLAAAIDESIIRPESEVEPEVEPEAEGSVIVQRQTPERKALAEVPLAASTVKTPKAAVAATDEVVDQPRLYPGGFTIVGLVFVTMAMVALLFTITVARYDTWVQGATEENMGDNQLMYFYAGLVAFTVFIVIAVMDLLRTPKGIPESAH